MKFNPTFLVIADLLHKCFSSQNYYILSFNQGKAGVVLIINIIIKGRGQRRRQKLSMPLFLILETPNWWQASPEFWYHGWTTQSLRLVTGLDHHGRHTRDSGSWFSPVEQAWSRAILAAIMIFLLIEIIVLTWLLMAICVHLASLMSVSHHPHHVREPISFKTSSLFGLCLKRTINHWASQRCWGHSGQ